MKSTFSKSQTLQEDAVYRDSDSIFFCGQDNKTMSPDGENLDIPTFMRKGRATYHHFKTGVVKQKGN